MRLLKYLLIGIIIYYLISKVGKFFLHLLFGKPNEPKQQHSKGSSTFGNIKINYKPKKDDKDFKGGEYIDYEEVK